MTYIGVLAVAAALGCAGVAPAFAEPPADGPVVSESHDGDSVTVGDAPDSGADDAAEPSDQAEPQPTETDPAADGRTDSDPAAPTDPDPLAAGIPARSDPGAQEVAHNQTAIEPTGDAPDVGVAAAQPAEVAAPAATGGACPGDTTVFVDASNAVSLGWLIRATGGATFDFTHDGLEMTIPGGGKVSGYVDFHMDRLDWCEPSLSVTGAAASAVGLNLFEIPPDLSPAVEWMDSFGSNWRSTHDYGAGPVPGSANDAPLANYFDPGTLIVNSVGFAFGTSPTGSDPQSALLQSITIGNTTYRFDAIPIFATEPTFQDAQCGQDAVITIPVETGLTYSIEAATVSGTVSIPPGTSVTVVADLDTGYYFDPDNPASYWTYTASTPVGCSTVVTPVAPSYTDVPCPGLDTVTIPSVTGVAYTNAADGSPLSGTVTIPNGSSLAVNAAATTGYVLDGSVASWTFPSAPVGGCPAASGGSLSRTGTDSAAPDALLGSGLVIAGGMLLLAHTWLRRRVGNGR